MAVRRQYSFANQESKGILYLVATPIGNLGDITQRAVEVLRSVDVIAAEDTRQTRKLLTHFQIEGVRLMAYHEHNKDKQGPVVVGMLQAGQQVALVSDAGMPGISDPGEDLVTLAIDAGIPVSTIPGANAALSALVASGMRTDRFTFIGFLPREKKARQRELGLLKSYPETLLFYEAPHRVKAMLQDLKAVLGDRNVAIARELTKRYEEFARGTVSQALTWIEEEAPRGEWVLVVEGASEADIAANRQQPQWQTWSIEQHVAHWMNSGYDQKEAIKQVAKERGVPKRDVYQVIHSL